MTACYDRESPDWKINNFFNRLGNIAGPNMTRI